MHNTSDKRRSSVDALRFHGKIPCGHLHRARTIFLKLHFELVEEVIVQVLGGRHPIPAGSQPRIIPQKGRKRHHVEARGLNHETRSNLTGSNLTAHESRVVPELCRANSAESSYWWNTDTAPLWLAFCRTRTITLSTCKISALVFHRKP